MPKSLAVELPDEIYEVLRRLAEEEGKTVQELSAEWIVAMAEKILNDPLERVIGSLRTGVPNWSDRHDEILGEYLQQKVQGVEVNENS